MPILQGPPIFDQVSANSWWAIYTYHQHEKSAANILQTKGCEVFLPLYEVIRRWKDRTVKLSLPLFPCYVFVRADASRRLDIVTTPGVLMIVSQGKRLAVVAPHEMRALQRAVQGPFRVEPHPYLQCGQRVRVMRGALEGTEGLLVRKKNLCRLVLSVDMLARSAAVEVNASDVIPVAPARHWLSSPSDMVLRVPAEWTEAS